VLGSYEAVDSLLGNLQAKFFCQNTGDTNEWASRLLGDRIIHVTSTGVSLSRGDDVRAAKGDSHSSNVSRAEQRRRFVEASKFTMLRKGGPANGFQVDCVVFNGGHLFQ